MAKIKNENAASQTSNNTDVRMLFHVIKNRMVFFIIPCVLVLAGLISFFVQGFNLDIDFTSGTKFDLQLNEECTSDIIKNIDKIVKDTVGVNNAVIQKTDKNGVTIKTPSLDTEKRKALTDKLKAEYKLEGKSISSDNVSPIIGKELTNNAILAVILAVLAMLVYIIIRFDYRSAIASILCLIHDMLIMLSAYTIFQIPINTIFIASILTILGYSINASIIMFDRVRENNRFKSKLSVADLVNKSIWQTMGRSINTTITTVLTIGVLFIVGVSSIKVFAGPILVGLFAGLYSSTLLAGNFYYLLRGENKK